MCADSGRYCGLGVKKRGRKACSLKIRYLKDRFSHIVRNMAAQRKVFDEWRKSKIMARIFDWHAGLTIHQSVILYGNLSIGPLVVEFVNVAFGVCNVKVIEIGCGWLARASSKLREGRFLECDD